MTPLEAGISLATDPATSANSLPNPVATRLVRLLALNGVALYAGVVALLHWLRAVPIHYTFMAGTLGFVLLFLALGMLVSGRWLGFFGKAQRRASPDWLPILLIWPTGFSILGCLALGLADPQARQQLTSALALPLALAAAAVPPLLLGRTPAWTAPIKLWQKLCEGFYALATVVAALVLFVAVYQALLNDPAPDDTATSVQPGFVCKSGATSATPEDELSDEDKCHSAPTKPAAATAAVVAAVAPINQIYILWSTVLLLAGGVILLVGRAFAARAARGATNETGAMAGSGASMLTRLAGLAEAEVMAQAGTLFGANGAPAGAALTAVIGKFMQPAGAGVATSPSALAAQLEQGAKHAASAEINRLSAQIAATSLPPAPVSVPTAGIAAAVAPAADPIPVPGSAPPAQLAMVAETATAAMAVPPAEPVASADPAPVAAAPVPATETAPAEAPVAAPSPAVDETKQLRENLAGMQDKMSKQEQTAGQLQDSLNGMSDKLAKQEDANKQLQANVSGLQGQLENQAKMLTQLAEEAQHSADENRRTMDSLTRLMQGTKAELDRLSKSQTAAS